MPLGLVLIRMSLERWWVRTRPDRLVLPVGSYRKRHGW
jgi:hypothetical protein